MPMASELSTEKPRPHEMEVAIAADATCDANCRAMTGMPLVGIKLALMLRMGLRNKTAMLAAIEGAELLAGPPFDVAIELADNMRHEEPFQPLLAHLEDLARSAIQGLGAGASNQRRDH